MKCHRTAEMNGLHILLPAAMILVVTAIGAAFGVQVLGDIRDDTATTNCAERTDGFTAYNETAQVCQNSTGGQVSVGTAEFNATVSGITGVGNISAKFGIIGTMIAAMVILGMLATFLVLRFRG